MVFFLDSFETKADREAKALEQRIRELVPIGMDIDEAIEILRADGVGVTDKYDPSETQEVYWADIMIRYKISFLDSVKTTVNIGKTNKYIICIEANWDGVITDILE